MKLHIILFIGCLFLFKIPSTQAQLVLYKLITQRDAALYIDKLFKKDGFIDSYINANGAAWKNEDGTVSLPNRGVVFGFHEYAWLFREGDIYFSYVTSFRPHADLPPICAENSVGASYDCKQSVRLFKQCHLFVFDQYQNIAAVQPLVIPQPTFLKTNPSCFSAVVAPAQVVNDTMLITVSYYDSTWLCTASGTACYEDIHPLEPDLLYKTTFLIRFDKDSSGKLVLNQDDTCLGKLNTYATITSARQALKKSNCT